MPTGVVKVTIYKNKKAYKVYQRSSCSGTVMVLIFFKLQTYLSVKDKSQIIKNNQKLEIIMNCCILLNKINLNY